ncbi:MAG TPA: hypothetical protein VN922_20190 [Bacteroidia bacterium]|nr:hypothetical protein [Bacteroidia bacterium]
MTTTNIHNLESLQRRKTEIAALCKEKEKAIGAQLDYISDNLGSIALRTIIGGKSRKDKSTKADIISLLISEGVETAMEIQQNPKDFKDKLVGFVKNAASGVINLLIK